MSRGESTKQENIAVSQKFVHEGIEKAIKNPNATEDRGRVTWIDNDVWLETDVERGSEVLEEKWGESEGAEPTQQGPYSAPFGLNREGSLFSPVGGHFP